MSLRPLQVALGGDISEDLRGVLKEMVGRALASPRRKPGPKAASATAALPAPAKVIDQALLVLADKGKDGTLKNRRSQWRRLLVICGDSWDAWTDGNAVRAIRGAMRVDEKTAPLGHGGKKALYDALCALMRIAREDLRLDVPDSVKQGTVLPRYESERDVSGLPPEEGLPAFSVEEARALLAYSPDLSERSPWFPQALRVAFLMGMHQVDMNSLRSTHLHEEGGVHQFWIRKRREKNGSLWINAPVPPLMFQDRDLRLVRKPIVPVKTNAGEVLRECADLAGVQWVRSWTTRWGRRAR